MAVADSHQLSLVLQLQQQACVGLCPPAVLTHPAACLRSVCTLQGPGTDQKTVQDIRDAIREGRELTVRILNYTRSGKPFWNMFTLAPMRDSYGQTRFFVGVQVRLQQTTNSRVPVVAADAAAGGQRELGPPSCTWTCICIFASLSLSSSSSGGWHVQ